VSKLAIVILNYNGRALLEQFLPFVIKYSSNASILVADNGSTDGSLDLLKDYFPSVTTIKLDKNYGFCGGYNRVLKQIDAEYYILLNSDVEVTPGWLDPLVSILDKNPDVAAVQPKILSFHERSRLEYAGAGGGLIDMMGYPYCRGRIFNYTEIDSGQYDDECEIFWATGACLCIRAQVFHQAGGFDDTFFAHMEEIDLCWRIRRMGFRINYSGRSTVFHVGAGTLSRSNPKKTYYNFRNGLTLLLKHLPFIQLVFKLPLRILLDYFAALKFLLEGKPKDAFSVIYAHASVVASLKKTIEIRKQLLLSMPYSLAMVTRRLIPFDFYILGRKQIH
jgi:GT2 family glycosyltransferase